MDDIEPTSGRRSLYWGSSAIPLVYLEVLPLQQNDDHNSFQHQQHPEITGAFVKTQLMKSFLLSTLGTNLPVLKIKWDDKQEDTKHWTTSSISSLGSGLLSVGDDHHPVLYLEQNNVDVWHHLWPCHCRGYAMFPNGPNKKSSYDTQANVVITDATIVRVFPFHSNGTSTKNCKDQLIGELPALQCSNFDDPLENQNPEAVKELKMRIRQLLSHRIRIGTTNDAYLAENRRQSRISNIQSKVQSYIQDQSITTHCTNNSINNFSGYLRENKTVNNLRLGDINSAQITSTQSIFQENALLVHSPHHGAGKSILIENILRKYCDVVHVIRPGSILAKYGIHADAALECVIHEVILAAAIKQKSIGIILDDLESILPPGLSAALDTPGDAANPILHASRAYLRDLTSKLKHNGQIPFPTKNPLYNVGGTEGFVLPVKLCFVAVITCPDDGFKSEIRRIGTLINDDKYSTVFDTLLAGRCRLPNLTATTRLHCFKNAFQKENLKLAPDLERMLPYLAASAIWARGSVFRMVANRISLLSTQSKIASLPDFLDVLSSLGKIQASGSDVQFLAPHDSSTEVELFGSVGGNNEAKSVLEDALGVHPERHSFLLSIGLSPPTGVLLYGPPGTGKTLIAKGVAQLLSGKNSSISVGGAFISLKSTDVARAEVGSGEKMLIEAFETARRNAPSVVFIDEFQALFTDRSNGGSGRLSTTLFQCMDNLKQWQDLDKLGQSDNDITFSDSNSGNRVIVLAATNTPWMVDKAFLRPGRFDQSIHVGLPNYDDRCSILRIHIERMNTKFDDNNSVISQLCDKLAALTHQYSGADIASLCRSAAVRCITTNCDKVDESHFHEALSQSGGPSTNNMLVERIEQWRP